MFVNRDILSTEELFEIIIWKMKLEVVKKKKVDFTYNIMGLFPKYTNRLNKFAK